MLISTSVLEFALHCVRRHSPDCTMLDMPTYRLNARQYLRQTGEYTMHGWSSGLYMQPFNETEVTTSIMPPLRC